MSRSTLPRTARARRAAAAAGLLLAMPLTMAAACQDEVEEGEPALEQGEEGEEGDMGEDMGDEGDD